MTIYVDADATGYAVIEACHRVKCFSVGILDSNQLEDEEIFDISLFKRGLILITSALVVGELPQLRSEMTIVSFF